MNLLPHDWIALGVSSVYVGAVVIVALRARPRLTIARERLPAAWKPWSADGR